MKLYFFFFKCVCLFLVSGINTGRHKNFQRESEDSTGNQNYQYGSRIINIIIIYNHYSDYE